MTTCDHSTTEFGGIWFDGNHTFKCTTCETLIIRTPSGEYIDEIAL